MILVYGTPGNISVCRLIQRIHAQSCNNHKMDVMRQIRILLSLLLLGSHCLLFGGTSGILDGRAIDKTTHEPLIAVNIQIIGTTLGSVTDPEVYYQINNIHAAVYDVKFSLIGYKSVIMKK